MNVIELLLATLDSSDKANTRRVINRVIKTRYLPSDQKRGIAEALFNIVAKEQDGMIRVDTYTKNLFTTLLLITMYTNLEFQKDGKGALTTGALSELELLKKDGYDRLIFEAVGDDYQETLRVIDDYFRDRLQPNAAVRFRNLNDFDRPFRGTIKDFNFRQLHHKFLIMLVDEKAPSTMAIRLMLGARPTDNAILLYGYIDSNAGISFQALCSARHSEDRVIDLNKPNEVSSLKLRYDSITGTLISIPSRQLTQVFEQQIKIIEECYTVEPAVEALRQNTDLDSVRHPQFPDDVFVYLMKQGYRNEGVWVRLRGGNDSILHGTLMNEPNNNFGCHSGETIRIRVVKNNSDTMLIAMV